MGQGIMRRSVARELGQGLAGHPPSLTDTRVGVHAASQFCTIGQTTGNASSLWALLAPGPTLEARSSRGSGLTPWHSSAPHPAQPPRPLGSPSPRG